MPFASDLWHVILELYRVSGLKAQPVVYMT